MKLIVEKSQLVKALEYVAMANYKTDLSDDSAIMLSCDNYTLSLIGGNNENHIEMTLEAEVEEVGEIIISATNLDKQIKGFPGKQIMLTGNHEFMYFETSEDVDDSMKCNMKVTAIESNKFEDYTAMKSATILVVNGNTLSSALSAATIAVDKKSAKDELKNVGIIMEKDIIDFVGFSSKRLSKYSIPTNGSNTLEEGKRFTMPLPVAKNIAKMFKKGKKDITIYLEKNKLGNYLRFQNGIVAIYSKILNYDFPDYSRILKNPADFVVTFSAANLKRVISGLSGMSKADVIVTLTPSENGMEFSIISDGSKTALAIPCTMTGNKTTLKLVGKDLKEAFSNISSDSCSLHAVKNSIYFFKEAKEEYLFLGSFCK